MLDDREFEQEALSRALGFAGARQLGKLFFCLSIMIYAVSFFLPTFEIIVEGNSDVSYGYVAFAIGFIAPLNSDFLGSRVFISWLANPLLWTGATVFALRRWNSAMIIGAMATILSTTLLFGDTNRDLIRSGYYVWMISMGMFTLSVAISAMRKKP